MCQSRPVKNIFKDCKKYYHVELRMNIKPTKRELVEKER